MQITEQDIEMFEEIDELLMSDEKPSIRLAILSETQRFKESVFHILNREKTTEQSPIHHPEGNVWIHTMMVVDEAAKVRKRSKNSSVLMWGALLHDIGKPDTTRNKKGKVTSYNHDKVGALLTQELLQDMPKNKEWIDGVVSLVRWHMQILFVVRKMPFADVEAMKKEVDLKELALLSQCDRNGRLNVDRQQVKRDVETFLRMTQGKK